jgi:hypothetical protein
MASHIDTNIFITKIGDFFFRILNKNDKHSRLIVNIYSSIYENELIKPVSDQVNKFSVYLSKSDLGCFRLCLLGIGGFIKGEYDYIQQTFIHVELQKFIYECFHKLEVNTDIEFCNIGDNFNRQIFNNIRDKSRFLEKNPFISYNAEFKCGEENKHDNIVIIDKLKSFSNELERLYYCKDNQFIFSHTVDDDDNNYIIQFYKIILKLKDEIPKDNTFQDDITLYYNKVNIKKFDTKELDNEMSINLPVFLTTDDKITQFGTFNTYILAGNYICKVFDYTEQCSKDLGTYKCFGRYSLIGDRYNDIFPLNIIKQSEQQVQQVQQEQQEQQEQSDQSVQSEQPEQLEQLEQLGQIIINLIDQYDTQKKKIINKNKKNIIFENNIYNKEFVEFI